MNILIDTNIVLDLLLEREPYVESAITIFDHVEHGTLTGYIAATTITNIFYILRKAKGRDVALASIQRLLIGLQLCAVNRQTIETALSLGLTDFEDGIQLACATLSQLDAVVTRDSQDFSGSTLPIYSPTDLLAQL
ncbi:PIN domain-containing protein [bacterium]|nr:PIN domain-containing protein [bacterium]